MVRAGSYFFALLVECIVVRRSAEFHPFKAGPVLKSLYVIDAQHGFSKFRMKFVKHRLSQSNRCVTDHTRYSSTDRVTAKTNLINQRDHFIGGMGIRTT